MSSAAKTRYRTDTRRFAKKNYIPEAQRQGFRAIKHSTKLSSPQTLGNLSDLGKAFDAAGIGWWLSYGALLGIIRDGNFVPSDDDIDIMVAEGTDPAQVRKTMEGLAGIFMTGVTYGSAVSNENYWFRDIYIDIYYAQDADGHRVDFSRFCGCALLMEHSRQKVKRITHGGIELNVPEDPPRYLERLYGPGWTKPDGGWLWYVHQRPIEIRGNAFSLAYCWFRIEVLKR